jgi:hypothetical protein
MYINPAGRNQSLKILNFKKKTKKLFHELKATCKRLQTNDEGTKIQ